MLFEILKRFAELRQGLLQIVGKHSRPEQVRRRTIVVGTRRRRAKIAPVVEITVTTTEPRESNEVDLLVDIQTSNKPESSVRSVSLLPSLNPIDHIVVEKIGGKL